MVGAAQLGVLAACVVLFVPMGLAGWHLSRNKMLFFSGALFITLAIFVHLAPYFPTFSHLIILSPSPPISCLPFIHQISFSPNTFAWPRSGPAAFCQFQTLTPADASDLLNGSWILIAGDSQARLLALALLRLVLDPESIVPVEAALFRRHSDYQILIPHKSIKVDFVWAPYEVNLTDLLLPNLTVAPRYPDVLVAGSGLWHMLHFTNASDYGVALADVRRSVGAIGLASTAPVHMFWVGMPELVDSMLNTEEKRERMNQAVRGLYDQEMKGSRILRGSGGPFFLLDIGSLSRRCGRRCTEDGMHYDGVVYEAALHVMLNALLIQSHQRL